MACDTKNNVQTSDYLSYYLTMNVNNICRVCLEKGSKLMPIFDAIKPPHFSILMMACASVQVLEGDGLPPYICQKCIAKLNVAFQFKTQCENADSKLRQCLENIQELQEQTDSELANYIDDDAKKDNTELLIFDEAIQHTAIITDIKTVELDTFQCTNETQLQEPQLEQLQNVQLDPGSGSSIPIQLEKEPPDFNIKLEEVAVPLGNNQKRKRQNKDHKCHMCNKVFRTKPGLVHHIRIHTGERPYVCHLCDKRFINGGHLHTHMRTHTGEKNHVCAACPKAFATAQQLTKHTIAIHTSERPYSCPYCSKRFASSSNLNTHIKIHTGEKNYYCDQCGKAFSTKGQLYQHMLIHTGEKAFLCEFCDKRFSQKAHLVRHLKMHQKLS